MVAIGSQTYIGISLQSFFSILMSVVTTELEATSESDAFSDSSLVMEGWVED